MKKKKMWALINISNGRIDTNWVGQPMVFSKKVYAEVNQSAHQKIEKVLVTIERIKQ